MIGNPEWATARLREYAEVCDETAEAVKAYKTRVMGNRPSNVIGPPPEDASAFKALPLDRREPLLRIEPVAEQILEAVEPRLISEIRSTWNMSQRADVARRAIATIESQQEVTRNLGPVVPGLVVGGLHPVVGDVAAPFWSNDQHTVAVNIAAQSVNAHLQKVVGRKDISEADLARQAFTTKDPQPGEPRLRFPDTNREVDPKTWTSRHQGAMEYGAGLFQAIRNITAHADPTADDLDPEYALECLASLSLYARWIDESVREESPLAK